MGQTISTMVSQAFPPKSTYSADDIPDLTGKVVIVTGASSGIGKECAKLLLEHNAKVYIAARDVQKSEKAINDLRKQTGKEAHFLKLDLANLKSLKVAAEEFQSKEKELHILYNNAGIMRPPIDMLTADGYDLQLGTNVLGHFYFTKLLLPTLISTAKTSPPKSVRVVTISSITHYMCGLDFNTFKDGPARRKFGTHNLYCQSKYGSLVYATELARRYEDQGIVSMSVNPGNIHSELQRRSNIFGKLSYQLILYPTPQGALTPLWGGTSAEGGDFNGKYLMPWARIGVPRTDSQDPKLGSQFWQWLEEQVEGI